MGVMGSRGLDVDPFQNMIKPVFMQSCHDALGIVQPGAWACLYVVQGRNVMLWEVTCGYWAVIMPCPTQGLQEP